MFDRRRVALVHGNVSLQSCNQLRHPLCLHEQRVRGEIRVALAELDEIFVVHAVAHLLQPGGDGAFAGAGGAFEEHKHVDEGHSAFEGEDKTKNKARGLQWLPERNGVGKIRS